MSNNRRLSERNRELLLVHINRVIEETATTISRQVADGTYGNDMMYPPNCGLTNEEDEALKKICGTPNIESALRKVIADAASQPVYSLLCILDGIADPDGQGWTDLSLLDQEDGDVQGEFLKTGFYDMYWEWQKIRPQKNWRLDMA